MSTGSSACLEPFSTEPAPREASEGPAPLGFPGLVVRAWESIDQTILLTDTAGRIVHVNAAFTRASGYTLEEVVGKTPAVLKSGKHKPDFYEGVWAAISRGDSFSGLFINRRKDGKVYKEEGTIYPVKDEAGVIQGYLAMRRDVTKTAATDATRQLEHQMEVLETLGNTVAHEFHDVLTVIGGYAQILTTTEDPDRIAEYAGEISTQVKRATAVTSRLLSFSRAQSTRRGLLDLNETCLTLCPKMHRILEDNVELVTEFESGPSFVLAESTHIEQIVWNLVVNARDAMANGGGVLTIRTANVDVPGYSEDSRTHHHSGPHVMLSVSDTGCGLDESVLSRIFDPLFSTKKDGRGTGLGLSVVYGLVRQSGGFVRVRSECGKGSTFEVLFPRESCGRRPIRD